MVSGVPQDTLSCPLLVLLHLNGLQSVVSPKLILFADVCRNVKNKQDQITLQKYQNMLENWGNTWVCILMLPSTILCECHGHPNVLNYSLTAQVLEEVMDVR